MLPRRCRHEGRKPPPHPGEPTGVACHSAQSSRPQLRPFQRRKQPEGFLIVRVRGLPQECDEKITQMRPQPVMGPQRPELAAINRLVAGAKIVQRAPQHRTDEQGLLFLFEDMFRQRPFVPKEGANAEMIEQGLVAKRHTEAIPRTVQKSLRLQSL